MKIVLVIDTYNAEMGAAVATKRLAEGLKKRGHQISIVSTDAVDGSSFVVKGFYLPGCRESQEKMQFMLGIPDKKVLRKAFADADIVQIQFPFYLAYGAAKVARAMKKCVVGAFHAQPQNFIGAMGLESAVLEKVMFSLLSFFLFGRAPVIQCPSQFAADLLQKGGNRQALRVVSNGIPDEYVPTPTARPESFGDNLVLLNVGRHAPEKRQSLLIEAVKCSKYANKIRLLLCGKGELSELLVTQGSQLPNPPMVQYVSQHDKLQYLNTADLYVHGSAVELESLACLEAIGCGLPCLIGDSPHSAAKQFALDPRFVFTHDDAASLTAKIDYWYENRAELATVRARVLAMAEQYRFEKCLDKMEALYRDALSGAFAAEVVMSPAADAEGAAT